MYLTPDLENMKNIQSLKSLGQEKNCDNVQRMPGSSVMDRALECMKRELVRELHKSHKISSRQKRLIYKDAIYRYEEIKEALVEDGTDYNRCEYLDTDNTVYFRAEISSIGELAHYTRFDELRHPFYFTYQCNQGVEFIVNLQVLGQTYWDRERDYGRYHEYEDIKGLEFDCVELNKCEPWAEECYSPYMELVKEDGWLIDDYQEARLPFFNLETFIRNLQRGQKQN